MTASHNTLSLRWWVGSWAVLLLAADASQAQTPLRGAPIAFRPSTTVPFMRPGSIIFGPSLTPGGPPGPQIGNRFVSQLMPEKATAPLLNNGSLQVSINPNPNLPNSIPFTFMAALPLGDRLGKNGVVFDPELLANIGFSPTVPLIGANVTWGPYLFPSIPPIQQNILNFGGDMFRRQRMMQDAALMAAAMAMPALPLPAAGAAPAPAAGAAAAPAPFGNPRPIFGGGARPAADDKDKDDDKADDKVKDDKKDDKKKEVKIKDDKKKDKRDE
jgi:hypothetical protein